MNIKKTLAAALAAAMALSMTACSGRENQPAPSTKNNAETSGTTEKTKDEAETKPQISEAETTASDIASDDVKNDYNYKVYSDHVVIQEYKGTDTDVVIPSAIDGVPVVFLSDYTFSGNTKIESVTIPKNVTEIAYGAFKGCINLKQITFQGDVPEIYCRGDVYNAWHGYTTFEGTPWLEKNIKENNGLIIIKDSLFGVSKDFKETSLTIPNNVTSISNCALAGCMYLTSITIPDSVKSIGILAFYDCENLTDITIPDSVTSIGYDTFGQCDNLTSITIPNSVTSIGRCAFYGCKKLENITIPDSVKSIGGQAFSDCEKLDNITIPDSVTSIGRDTFNSAFGSYTSVNYKGKTYNASISEYQELYNDINFGINDFIIEDNLLVEVKSGVSKIELPDSVKGISDNAFKNSDKSIIIAFKGKNYNLANLELLKFDMAGGED